MERFGLAGLLVVCLPVLARAQHVEVSLFGGSYLPVPSSNQSGEHVDCSEEPCPDYFFQSTTFGSGAMFGGRVTFQVNPRYGVDITLQGTRVTNHTVSSAGAGSEDVRLLLLSVQPHYQIPIRGSVEAVVGAGLTMMSGKGGTHGLPEAQTLVGWRNGLAFSGALRAGLPGSLRMEVNGTLHSYVLSANEQNPFAFVWGLGLTYAFPSRGSE